MALSSGSAHSGPWVRLQGLLLLLLLFTGLVVLLIGGSLLAVRAPASPGRPEPLDVTAKDQEIAWLYPANNLPTWERFVAAMQQVGDRLQAEHPDLEIQDAAAFPEQTTATPEIALKWKSSGRRLVIRWYKLTSQQKTDDWVEALIRRQPPPLAIVGGSTSDAARELATLLQNATATLPAAKRPLLLLTTASADEVMPRPLTQAGHAPSAADVVPVRLTQIYPDRTFRYCFTNKQMATTATRFLWLHDELRPDTDTVHMVCWDDDAYSRDLVYAFWQSLQMVGASTPGERAWAIGSLLRGATQPGDPGGLFVPYQPMGSTALALRLDIRIAELTNPLRIDSSVGNFDNPNRMEAQNAVLLLKALVDHPDQARALLAVTGQTGPSRRFLRALALNAPEQTRRCVVVTGDALSFNTIYRDGATTWPIQDLPYQMVFFCHRNPIDTSAGFRPFEEINNATDLTSTTGTEDLLLYDDLIASLALGYEHVEQPCHDAQQLADQLHHLSMREGKLGFDPDDRPLFNKEGNRHTGTGEHIVYLSPEYQGPRVLPRARVEVWSWRTEGIGENSASSWSRIRAPLEVRYDRIFRQGDAP
jgi:hypothetical protein